MATTLITAETIFYLTMSIAVIALWEKKTDLIWLRKSKPMVGAGRVSPSLWFQIAMAIRQ